MKQSLVSWGVFAVFVVLALVFNWHDRILRFDGAMGAAKGIVWVVFILFTAYSIYCSNKESIFKSIGSMARLHWGRQIGIDLYLGLLLFLSVIYLHEGPIAVLLWFVPVLLFANLATLLYISIHFESLVARFLS